jgi:formylglycine-generating enzyme required for sulfatase activity
MAQDAFRPTVENHASAPGAAPEGMVWIPGGEFSMGAADPTGPDQNEVGMHAIDDARPIHRVYVDGFWMDKTEVTNRQFAALVNATGYVTVAERTPRAEDFPGAPRENLVAGAPILIKAISRWRTTGLTASPALRGSRSSHPTATGSMTWPGTCGSG